MPHRRCRKSSAMFLCGVLILFFGQITIYPVRGQTGSEPIKIERSAAKVDQNQSLDPAAQIIIQEGDTLWSLADKYEMSLEQLTQINQIRYPDHIRVGQKLMIQAQKQNTDQPQSHSQLPKDNPQKDNPEKQIPEEVKMFEFHMEEASHLSRGQQVPEHPLQEQVLNEQVLKEQTSKVQESKKIIETAQAPKKETYIVEVAQSEIDLLARVIYAEARGEDFEGQVAVGAVVLNRLKSSGFPNTIHDVVYQRGAFTAVIDKQIHLTPNEEAYKAAEAALRGEDPTGGALFYFNPKTATDQWIKSRAVIKTIGNHTFSI